MKKKRVKDIPMGYFFFKLLMIMKLSLFFLCLSVFSVFATESYSQSTKLSISVRNESIENVLKRIEDESEYRFFYSGEINTKERVSIDTHENNIQDILNELFQKTDISYKIVGRQVALYSKSEGESPFATAQSLQISGTVTNEAGEPIPGATVMIKGTTVGTITNFEGVYTLGNVPNDAILVFSFVGMREKEISVQGKSVINVVLAEDVIGVDEVVVIGYGTRQKKNLIGAVDQVNADVIEDRPVSNATQALQGASANLIIQQKSMNPNDNNMNINIRGVSTMSNNDPLIVIDGLISGTSTLNNLNPNDIENVSVLKDAGSAAIYGSRSANGVILVTTKKGAKTGKPNVRFSSMVGYEDPDILFQPVQGWRMRCFAIRRTSMSEILRFLRRNKFATCMSTAVKSTGI